MRSFRSTRCAPTRGGRRAKSSPELFHRREPARGACLPLVGAMKMLPANSVPYKKTEVFTDSSVPRGLLREHSTKPGAWGRIVVIERTLTYRILEPVIEEVRLYPERFGVIEPTIKHEIVPNVGVRFYVEFHHVETKSDP